MFQGYNSTDCCKTKIRIKNCHIYGWQLPFDCYVTLENMFHFMQVHEKKVVYIFHMK